MNPRRRKEIIHSTSFGFVIGLAVGLLLAFVETSKVPKCKEEPVKRERSFPNDLSTIVEV